jgi:ATP-binding cassette subfamily B protein
MAFSLFIRSGFKDIHSIFASPWLSVVLFVLVIISSVYSVLSNAKCSKELFRMMDGVMPVNRMFFYYIGLMTDVRFGKDVRIYHQTGALEQVFRSFVDACDNLSNGMGKMKARFSAINAAISTLLGGIVYLFVGLKALIGLFSIGSVVQYVGAINQFTNGLSQLITSSSDFWLNAEYVKLYLDFLDTPSPKYKGTLPVEKRSDNEYEFEFKNVSFKYPGSESYALKNFSLKLRIGEKLAVVGMNGSGKTTMIKLLCRLYDPQEGEILLNGINIQKYDYNEYLSLFSVVFQDFQLFAFSAGQNVAAAVEYDRDKAMECLNEAGAGERIRQMAKGIDTPLYKVDEDGVEISGGEAQKIAIARALYKDAPFIVLDEPTAALDPVAEYEIYSKFNEIVGTKTAIYISHRLSSCRFCDDIAVFHQGEMIQRGSHEELLKNQKGKYYELWNAQAQYYTEKEDSSATAAQAQVG